ncbi:Probable sensor histidine kinase TcrY [Arthrobacter agilis]|uniref:sensor histidine kinase n=1 Tax=Arthrobacter agilis TaxID=37921 RepID=UPI000F6E24F6|nr:HAMP domain-containing sensor histidine kinase [Arthrobacter agilis]VDR31234.1 Probable sensor histidine kinase TcrY [Arthrobacter agilis]
MIKRWNAASLRSQLVAIIMLLMIVTVGITGLATVSLLRDGLIDRVDQDLSNNVQNVSRNFYTNPQGDSSVLRYYAAVLDGSGQVTGTNQLDGAPDLPDLSGLTRERILELQSSGLNVPSTDPTGPGWRVQVYSFRANDGFFAIASPLKTVNDSLQEATEIIFTSGLVTTTLASLIAFITVTRQFAPLARVERTAAGIAAGDLTRRVAVERPATEIGRLSRSLNAMLAHIERAFAARTASETKMRRFVADASHELRTPLVTIRGYSELYRHGALQKDEDVAAAMGRIESEAIRMGQLVEDLLTLARIDEQRPLEVKPVDLKVLGHDAAFDARATAPDRSITVIGLDGGTPRPAPTRGDEARLRQVIANLMTNALRYTPEGTPIEIAVGVAPVLHGHSDSVLEVRDHGPGISDADAAKVFERFYRADSSRYRETGGTGLGLAIVAALVAQHDGSVRLEETQGGGATLSIRLPHIPADQQDGDDAGASRGASAPVNGIVPPQRPAAQPVVHKGRDDG